MIKKSSKKTSSGLIPHWLLCMKEWLGKWIARKLPVTILVSCEKPVTYSLVSLLRQRNTRYKDPQLVAQHCFVASFGSTFGIFHLVWSTCHATKTFVSGWRKLLGKAEHRSTLSNKFWLCCLLFFIKLSTCHATNLLMLKVLYLVFCRL